MYLRLLAGAVLLFLSTGLYAQSTGQISGSVTDPTGAVIPGASVVITKQETGAAYPLQTNPSGEFILPALSPGTYSVSAQATGFQKAEQKDIVLQVGGKVRVELTVQVASATVSVEVTGTLTSTETETAAVSNVITGKQMANLALPARNFVALALLTPGAAPSDGLNTNAVGVLGNVEISVNGGRTTYNNWEIDGGNNSDQGSNSTLNTYPSLDAIGEFRVTTSTYGAEVGLHGGAQIQVSTKSGTSNFHGSIYEFLRNEKLDANPFFTNRQLDPPGGKAPKKPNKRNEYGYTIGGPFYIPGVYNDKKDKTFFFWSQAWRRFRESQVIQGGVPTLLQRQGNFSECLPGNPNFSQKLVDDGCTFPSNAGPVTGLLPALDSNGVELMNALIPLPNNGSHTYTKSTGTPVNWRQELIRVDQNINDRTRLFVRYTQDAWSTVTPDVLWGGSSFDTVKTDFQGPGKSAVLNFSHSFTPSIFSETIVGYTVDHIVLNALVGPSSPSGSITRSSSFNAPHIFSGNSSFPLLPQIQLSGGSQVDAGFDTGYFPWKNSNPIATLKQNFVWIKGTHTFKFGAFVEKFRKNEQFEAGRIQGYALFSTDGTTSTGNAVADLLSGVMSQYSEANKRGKGFFRYTDFEPYFQDDWKVTPRLTLNLGVRYYLFTRMIDAQLQQSAFFPELYNPALAPLRDADGFLIPGSGSIFTQFGNGLVQCGVGVIPDACQNGEYKNIAPRFGFAWDPKGDGKTSIRGGAGIFYEALNGNEAGAEATQGGAPFAFGSDLFNLNSWTAIGAKPGLLSPASIVTQARRSPYPRTYQFSLMVQRQFSPNDLLSVGYVGNLGNFLNRRRELNLVPKGLPTADQLDLINGADTLPFRPFQGYSNIQVVEDSARSNYHSLQVSYRHQVGSGLTVGAAYTWSHAIDYLSNPWAGRSQDEHNLNRWRGNSDIDRRHMLVLNYVYDLPFLKNGRGVAKQVLGGWQVSGITTFLSGTPLDIGCGLAGLNTGIGGGMRCNSLGEQSGESTVNDSEFGPTAQWFNVNAFAQPNFDQLFANDQPGMFGYLGRNTLRGPGRNNWDLSLFKNFPVAEGKEIQFRFETFNSWNHTQWRGINTDCSDTVAAGQACGTAGKFGQVNSAWDPRIIQLGLKVLF